MASSRQGKVEMGNAHRPKYGCKEQQIAQFLLLSTENSRAYGVFWCEDMIEVGESIDQLLERMQEMIALWHGGEDALK